MDFFKSTLTIMPTPNTCNAFGTCLARLRELRGLSQKAVALSAGVDCSYLSGVERGRRPLPRDRQVERIARAMGATKEEFEALNLALALSRAYQAGAPLWGSIKLAHSKRLQADGLEPYAQG